MHKIIALTFFLLIISCNRTCNDLSCPAYSRVILPANPTLEDLNQYDYLYRQMDLNDRVNIMNDVLKNLQINNNEGNNYD